MRKLLASAAVLAALSAPASAAVQCDRFGCREVGPTGFPVVVGLATGAAVGYGLQHGWFAPHAPAGLTTVGGAVAGGLVAGIGTMVLLHSISTPCTGFRIAIDTCRNGRLVR